MPRASATVYALVTIVALGVYQRIERDSRHAPRLRATPAIARRSDQQQPAGPVTPPVMTSPPGAPAVEQRSHGTRPGAMLVLSTVAGGFSNTALISNVANIATLNPTARTSQVNPALYGPASTPGQFASFVYLRHNTLNLLDMSINKEVRIRERLRMTWRLVALNFLNHPFFDIGDPNPTSTTFGQITDTTAINNGTRRVQFRVSIDW